MDDFTLEFCHIYRGTLRWHLLTTGWSTFVNNKKLVAGGKKNFLHNSFFSFFLRLHRLLATTMPSRRRTLLKIIILDDIGFVSFSLPLSFLPPFLGFTSITDLYSLRACQPVSPISFQLFHFVNSFLLLIRLYCEFFHGSQEPLLLLL